MCSPRRINYFQFGVKSQWIKLYLSALSLQLSNSWVTTHCTNSLLVSIHLYDFVIIISNCIYYTMFQECHLVTCNMCGPCANNSTVIEWRAANCSQKTEFSSKQPTNKYSNNEQTEDWQTDNQRVIWYVVHTRRPSADCGHYNILCWIEI